ncbi:Flp pilus assembly protein TadB [hydrothermal vent metagenome]|uniref:Flp pilus assembly protein TadB n=1 Tax=hydrothermal vent metagenome TaxID=652676 RepID=A0A3B0UQK7_9ZZZZ
MSPLILGFLIVVFIGALGLAFVPALVGSGRAEKRIKSFNRDSLGPNRPTRASRERDERLRVAQKKIKEQTKAKSARKKRISLQARIYQAGMKITPAAFIRNSIILGAVIFIIAFLLEVPLLFSAIFGLAGGYVLPRWYLGRRKKKFQKKFLDELPNAVEAIVRGVKTGLPLNDCIRVVANEVKEPVRSEFARVLNAQSMGKSMDKAIAMIYERVPLSEVNFFVVVISVQQQSGGNLSEALSNLSRVLRDRKKLAGKVKAMSSEAKASAMIIGSLPFIVATLVSFVTPSYLLPLIQTPVGNIALGVAVLMMSIGVFIMNRMIQFDY